MSSISTLNNSSYYQLSDPSAGSGGSSASNSTSALLQALNGVTSSGQTAASSSSDAYLLDLSPQALAMMNGTSSASAASVSPLGASSASFTLSASQQQTIATILDKYKDAPYTQATFDSIQNDLQAAGLDPKTLGRLDQAQSFNPTALFVDDLNGDTTAADAMTNPDESAKSSNYMQQIISEWKQMTGSTGDSSPSASVSPTSAASAS